MTAPKASTRTSNDSISWLLILGLIFHLTYIGTVFDCYFTSPVVHGMQSFRMTQPLARRLVLIVGDGLRADLLFGVNGFKDVVLDAPEVVAPYLRDVIERRGAFGVSHTRVPTESRPGHVAIIGGMYEDVSAVTKGWKTNPVEFDSVFNQSSHTFSFGSPDILPMFAHGATPGKVKMWCYQEEDEDFTKDATALDLWVLSNLRILFQNATADPILESQLRSEKVVFFLHLLGLDTTGHSYRPFSKEYMRNIQVVDSIVRQTELLLGEFYGDEETSFIFTADHGMSKIGNHGDGDPDNTRTPLIAWGASLRPPLPSSPSHPSTHDIYSAPWNLNHLHRLDVSQADIAPLMATLLGLDWPVNSVGVLPDVDPHGSGYVDWEKAGGERGRAEAAIVNAKVILEHYRVKHEIKKSHALFYAPYPPLNHQDAVPGSSQLSDIESLFEKGEWNKVRESCFELIGVTLEGLRYLQTYDRTLIRGIVLAAYLGWAAYSAVFILVPRSSITSRPYQRSQLQAVLTSTSWVTLFSFWILFAVQRSPWTFYLYITFPCYFWYRAISRGTEPFLAHVSSPKFGMTEVVKVVGRGVLIVSALLSMVAAYTHRSIWSAGFLIIGVLWPLVSWSNEVLKNRLLLLAWIGSCLVTGMFPLLGVDKKESLAAILSGGLCTIALGSAAAGWDWCQPKSRMWKIYLIQLGFIAITMVITTSSVINLQAKAGLPLLNQVCGWVVLGSATLLPFLLPLQYPDALSKMTVYFLAFSPCFIILSISVEGLFYVAYSMTLVLWIEVEASLRLLASFPSRPQGISNRVKSKVGDLQTYKPRTDDLRIALFFLFFVQVGFFGTGNVASISSFYLEPVYRLMPIFRPFLMAALLVFKIVAPYVILSVAFATLNARLRLPPFSLFLVAMTLTDGMTVTFFFNVTDIGSWLEIGQTISFFCITSLLLVWSAGICAAGELLMADVLGSTRTRQKVD
ncbi:hypothetical protein JAAARDRAFT_71932 [Jaapia argillacea MUCL 33604]|uniref:GPI ethanolamine phosphate transferase 1 n=1 Tax=Jaapia argillacea MUCL 33604 TaxID=933084 RepID=A0A067PWD9_9AGAM|nr:hypothetical protein JAAARDRAFT_71932 [Jaapia argillacea MUCL 33604]